MVPENVAVAETVENFSVAGRGKHYERARNLTRSDH